MSRDPDRLAPRIPDPATGDPWVEVISSALENNVRELYRYTGKPLLAVVKNNANGIGVRQVGPILDAMPEVLMLAVVRVDEALALRECGVKKPILMMAHVAGREAELLVRAGIRLTPFHDDALEWLGAISERIGEPVPVHLFVDTGMNRIGMPHDRAVAWIQQLSQSGMVAIEGTYTMFSGANRDGQRFDVEHLRRFDTVVAQCRELGIGLGLLHGAPSLQIVSLPESRHLDMIRPGGAIYGLDHYRNDEAVQPIMNLQPVFRLRARVARVERLMPGEGVSFEHRYRAVEPTWVATVPIGHTDGYPHEAAGQTVALVGDRLYPIIGVVSSNHTILEVGNQKTIEVGDVATLIGPDRAEIAPIEVARRGGVERDYWIMTKLNALLHRVVVKN